MVRILKVLMRYPFEQTQHGGSKIFMMRVLTNAFAKSHF